jgi:hypothetical protein
MKQSGKQGTKKTIINKLILGRAKTYARKLFLKINRAHEAGNHAKVSYLVNKFLKSFYVKYAAVCGAYREISLYRKSGIDDLVKVAEKLNPWEGTDEEVKVHVKPKESNEHEFRTIMEFGLENRALQMMVKSVLDILADLHPSQFAVIGGRNKAYRNVLGALKDGYIHVIQVDIKDCFSSFNGERISDNLPVPPGVTRNVLLSRNLNLNPGNLLDILSMSHEDKSVVFKEVSGLLDTFVPKVRSGIPQGSCVSSLVAEILLASVIPVLPELGRVVAYADNFLLMATNTDDLATMKIALGSVLKNHPIGPLRLETISSSDGMKPFDFLGAEFFRMKSGYFLRPSQRNMWKFKHRFRGDLKIVKNQSAPLSERKYGRDQLRGYVRRWVCAFSEWDGAEKFRAEKLEAIEKAFTTQEKEKILIKLKKGGSGELFNKELVTHGEESQVPPWDDLTSAAHTE